MLLHKLGIKTNERVIFMTSSSFKVLAFRRALVALAGVALFSGALTVLAHGHSVQTKDQDEQSGLVQVEAQYVCMVNNQRFEKTLIPVKWRIGPTMGAATCARTN
jgi:hypothetical protein